MATKVTGGTVMKARKDALAKMIDNAIKAKKLKADEVTDEVRAKLDAEVDNEDLAAMITRMVRDQTGDKNWTCEPEDARQKPRAPRGSKSTAKEIDIAEFASALRAAGGITKVRDVVSALAPLLEMCGDLDALKVQLDKFEAMRSLFQ